MEDKRIFMRQNIKWIP